MKSKSGSVFHFALVFLRKQNIKPLDPTLQMIYLFYTSQEHQSQGGHNRSALISPCSLTPVQYTPSCYLQLSHSITHSTDPLHRWSARHPSLNPFLIHSLRRFILMTCLNHFNASHFTHFTLHSFYCHTHDKSPIHTPIIFSIPS